MLKATIVMEKLSTSSPVAYKEGNKIFLYSQNQNFAAPAPLSIIGLRS
jgi:hypothetical protein